MLCGCLYALPFSPYSHMHPELQHSTVIIIYSAPIPFQGLRSFSIQLVEDI